MAIINRDFGDQLYVIEEFGVVSGSVLPFYGTLKKADFFFEYRLDNDPWIHADIKKKKAALIQATRAIDRLNYIGKQTVGIIQQFPRDFQTSVPVDIEQACYEIALKLLDGVDTDTEADNLSSIAQDYGGIRSRFIRDHQPVYRANGIASATAWQLLQPYLADAGALVLTRVS